MSDILDIDFRYNGNDSSGLRLDMILRINNDGDLEVQDITPYEQWDADGNLGDNWAGINRNNGEDPSWKFIVVERIIADKGYEESEMVNLFGNNEANSIEDLRHNTVYEVPGNGLYHYQKLLIPYNNENLVKPDRMYYDPETMEIIQYDDSEIVGRWSVFEKIIENDEEKIVIIDNFGSENFDEVYNLIVDNQYNCCFYYSGDTFSMFDLIECYVMKEHARLKEMLKNNCAGTCSSNSKANYDIDLLLAAIIVVGNLIRRGDFFEAQRIIDSLDTCGNLCKDVRNNLKGCGCGRN